MAAKKEEKAQGSQIRTLLASEIECRVGTMKQNGCSLLLYKDARVDMRMLDEVYGPNNWQRSHELINGNLFCTISVWDADKGVWVNKQDVGTESNTEKEKGQASDAFKRAAFNWGIGRELYTAPFIWITLDSSEVYEKTGYNGSKSFGTNTKFNVQSIEYNQQREISKLVEDKVGDRNPSVAMTGEFINAIFDFQIPGIEICIDESCTISLEDYMSVQKDSNGGILKTKVKNSTTKQSYEEHGHLSDTFRYIVHDLCHESFIEFSNRRKRNLYAGKGMLDFFNPDTVHNYTDSVVYIMPNVAGTFLLVHTRRCGNTWHLTDAMFKDTSSVDEIKKAIMCHEAKTHIFECSPVYYQMVKELRQEMKGADIRVIKEYSDVDKRISATSDFIKKNLLLSPKKFEESREYGNFVTNLMDYNVDCENKGASTVLSGWGHYIIKSRSS